MNIDSNKIKSSEDKECYKDENGLTYDNAEDYLQSAILGFCTCGYPAGSLMFLRDALRHVDNLKQLVWTKKKTFEQWEEETHRIFGTTEAAYFVYYVLDEKKLTEHGGSVPGWLTDKGKALLQDLDEIHTRNQDDNKQ